MAADLRPTAPIVEGDLREPKTFYHNAAYKTSRVAINLEKMKVGREGKPPGEWPARRSRKRVRERRGPPLHRAPPDPRACAWLPAAGLTCRPPPVQILKERLADCVRREGVNYIDKCEQVRVPAISRSRDHRPE